MAGIAGIGLPGKYWQVKRMLEKLSHRGLNGFRIVETQQATLGVTWPRIQNHLEETLVKSNLALDEVNNGHFSSCTWDMTLQRDPFGVVPLYYGKTIQGIFCFASEVKALLTATCDVNDFLQDVH